MSKSNVDVQCPFSQGFPKNESEIQWKKVTAAVIGAYTRSCCRSSKNAFFNALFCRLKRITEKGRPTPKLLNRSVMRLKFKMLTVKQVMSQIRSKDWFVTIDLKYTYFHVSILPSHRKFLIFAFRGEAYQYRVLPFGLVLSPRTFTKCVDAAPAPLRLQGIRILNYIDNCLILAHSEQMGVRHRDIILAHMKELGLRLNARKSVLSPLQRTTYLGVVWDLTTMQARLSPARIESILTAVRRVREGLSFTVKQFQRLLGLMAATSNVIHFGLLYMRPLQWWLKTKGFSPRVVSPAVSTVHRDAVEDDSVSVQ